MNSTWYGWNGMSGFPRATAFIHCHGCRIGSCMILSGPEIQLRNQVSLPCLPRRGSRRPRQRSPYQQITPSSLPNGRRWSHQDTRAQAHSLFLHPIHTYLRSDSTLDINNSNNAMPGVTLYTSPSKSSNFLRCDLVVHLCWKVCHAWWQWDSQRDGQQNTRNLPLGQVGREGERGQCVGNL